LPDSIPNNRLKFKNLQSKLVDVSSKKLPIILIIVLLSVLMLQIVTNNADRKFIDAETCEIWVEDSLTKKPRYLNEFNPKCLDFKNLNP